MRTNSVEVGARVLATFAAALAVVAVLQAVGCGNEFSAAGGEPACDQLTKCSPGCYSPNYGNSHPSEYMDNEQCERWIRDVADDCENPDRRGGCETEEAGYVPPNCSECTVPTN